MSLSLIDENDQLDKSNKQFAALDSKVIFKNDYN